MSATDSIAYAMKQGGGVVIQESYYAGARRTLDKRARTALRDELRRRIVARLAEATGLPFHLAITNITLWEESEVDPEPMLNFRRDHGDQSVMLVTKCTVRVVQYPDVEEKA